MVSSLRRRREKRRVLRRREGRRGIGPVVWKRVLPIVVSVCRLSDDGGARYSDVDVIAEEIA